MSFVNEEVLDNENLVQECTCGNGLEMVQFRCSPMIDSYYVMCSVCMKQTGYFDDLSVAVQRWNRINEV